MISACPQSPSLVPVAGMSHRVPHGTTLKNNFGPKTLRGDLPWLHLYCRTGLRKPNVTRAHDLPLISAPVSHDIRSADIEEGIGVQDDERENNGAKARLRGAIYQPRRSLRQDRDFGSRSCGAPPGRTT